MNEFIIKHGFISKANSLVTGNLTVSEILHESTDVDKFLVPNNGLVKYRTGVEVLSDIGGAPSTGSNNYIQNQNSSAQSASMWINGIVKTDNYFIASFQDQYSFQEGRLYPDKMTIYDGMMDTTVKVDSFGVHSSGMNGTLTLSGDNGVAISGLSASTSDSVLVESSGVIGKRNISDMISGDLDSIYLRLDATNDPITGALTIDNDLTVTSVLGDNKALIADINGKLQSSQWGFDGNFMTKDGVQLIGSASTLFYIYGPDDSGMTIQGGNTILKSSNQQSQQLIVIYDGGSVNFTYLTDSIINSSDNTSAITKGWANNNFSNNSGSVTSVGLSAPTGFIVTNTPVTSSGVLTLDYATGYSLPTNLSQDNWDIAYDRRIEIFSTIGNSGAASFHDNALNIPNYTLEGLGFDGGDYIQNQNAAAQSASMWISGNIKSSQQLISTVPTGTAPLSVVSTTLVSNLNADLLDGHDASYFTTEVSNNYVPYTGATTNVDLNSKTLVNTSKLSVGSTTESSKGVAYFNGNVGIGATNPDSLLSVGGPGELGAFSVTGFGVGNIATFRDKDGENVFRAIGSLSNNDLEVSFGDIDEVYEGNYFTVTRSKTYFVGGKVGIGINDPSEKLDVIGNIKSSQQLISTIASGTAPLSVVSTTLVSNLNADLLDGHHWSEVTSSVSIPDTQIAVGTGTGIEGDPNLTWDGSQLRVDKIMSVTTGGSAYIGFNGENSVTMISDNANGVSLGLSVNNGVVIAGNFSYGFLVTETKLGIGADVTTDGSFSYVMVNTGNNIGAPVTYETKASFATALGLVSDASYDSSWNGVTDVAPSKNAVYDIVESLANTPWMVYPAAGIALSTGSAWDSSIPNNSNNWNTAYSHSQLTSGNPHHVTWDELNGSLTAPNPPGTITLTEYSNYVSVQWAEISSNDYYEVWQSQTSELTGFTLIGLIKNADFTEEITFIDNTYNRKAITYYRIYAVAYGKSSIASTASIILTQDVPDVTGIEISEDAHHIHIMWENPEDLRWANTSVKIDFDDVELNLSEANATLVYTGRNGGYVYKIPDADRGKYFKVWITANTRT